jgi:PelA/Pel-15E family pectate lyase
MHWSNQSDDGWHYCGTFDNRTTTEQIKFLAGVFTATKRDDVKAALMKGLDYVFAAQYPNGGWPQNVPVERGYHEAITLNDDAMVHILEVLHGLAEGDNHLQNAAEIGIRAGFELQMLGDSQSGEEEEAEGFHVLARVNVRLASAPSAKR